MQVTGETLYISSKQGKKQDGSEWFCLKFLDEALDEFFVAFVEREIFTKVQTLAKRTPVTLSLNLVPGSKYYTIEDIEILD